MTESQPKIAKVGDLIWVPNVLELHDQPGGRWYDPRVIQTPLWVPAEVVNITDTNVDVLTALEPCKSLNFKLHEVLPVSNKRGVDDLSTLSQVNPATVLDTVLHRFQYELGYSDVGPVLLSMNPYRDHTLADGRSIFHSSILELVHRRANLQPSESAQSKMTPHVFQLAQTAYATGRETLSSQSIVPFGEGGGGKSYNLQHALKYLLRCGASAPGSRTSNAGITRQLEAAQTVLAAFGQASTRQCVSSSRQSVFYDLQFAASGELVGAEISTAALDRSRVTQQIEGERNFDMFYQMISGIPSTEADALGLLGIQEYEYLTQSDEFGRPVWAYQDAQRKDAENFRKFSDALHVLGMPDQLQQELYRVLAGILMLGNMQFTGGAPAKLRSTGPIEAVTRVWNIDPHDLMHLLTTQDAGASQARSPLTGEEATSVRDEFARTTYQYLVAWMVDNINHAIARAASEFATDRSAVAAPASALVRTMDQSPRGAQSPGSTTGGQPSFSIYLLDTPGFESCDFNGLQQLTSNYQAEKLQHLFTQQRVTVPQGRIIREGVEIGRVEVKSNADVLSVIEQKAAPVGIFATLEDATSYPAASDVTIAAKLVNIGRKQRTGAVFQVSGDNPRRPVMAIEHSAAQVVYDINGMLQANRATCAFELKELAVISGCRLLADIFRHAHRDNGPHGQDNRRSGSSLGIPSEQDSASGGGGSGEGQPQGTPRKHLFFDSYSRKQRNQGTDVVANLRQWLDGVLETIKDTGVHFIQCVRSNHMQQPDSADTRFIHHQLQYTNTYEAVQLQAGSYAHVVPLQDVYSRYILMDAQLAKKFGIAPPSDTNMSTLVSDLLRRLQAWVPDMPGWHVGPTDTMGASLPAYQIGRTSAYMHSLLHEQLEQLRGQYVGRMDEAAADMQRLWRGHKTRTDFKQRQQAVATLQASLRGKKTHEAFHKQKDAAATVKSFVRTSRDRQRFLQAREGVGAIQRAWKGYSTKTKYTRVKLALLQVHILARGWLLRQDVLDQYRAVVRIQRIARRFLQRQRAYWQTVLAALLIQATWRSFAVRLHKPHVVQYLREKRYIRAMDLGFRRLQATFRRNLVCRRFTVMRFHVIILQTWWRSHYCQKRWRGMQRAAQLFGALVRGYVSRKRVRDMRAEEAAADEVWVVSRHRAVEAEALLKEGVELQSAAFWKGVRSKRSSAGALGGVKKQDNSSAIAGVTPGEGLGRVVDADITTDIGDIYPDGWSQQLAGLERSLLGEGSCSVQVAVGASHTVVLTSQGRVYTFGWGDRGQLGHRDTQNQRQPVLVHDLVEEAAGPLNVERRGVGLGRGMRWGVSIQVTNIVCGFDHTLALTSSGDVFAWGANNRGQLGLGHTDAVCQPNRITAFNRKIREIAAGRCHSVFLTTAGSVYTCGAGVATGHGPVPLRAIEENRARPGVVAPANLNLNSPLVYVDSLTGGSPRVVVDRCLPTGLKALSKFNVRQIAAGWGHTLALTHNGDVYAWGAGESGQLGIGLQRSRQVPALLQPPSEEHLMSRTKLVTLEGAQRTAMVEQGLDRSADDVTHGRQMLFEAQEVAQILAEQAAGNARPATEQDMSSLPYSNTGYNASGQRSAYTQPGMEKVYKMRAISCGGKHSLAVNTIGVVYAWGSNSNGQLGLGDRRNRTWPTPVGGPLAYNAEAPVDVISIDAGARHSMAMTRQHNLYHWGAAGVVAESATRDVTGMQPDAADPSSFMDPIESLLPTQLYLTGTEGYKPIRMTCSGSSSLSVTAAVYETSRNTDALVEAVLLRLAEETEELFAEGPEDYYDEIDAAQRRDESDQFGHAEDDDPTGYGGRGLSMAEQDARDIATALGAEPDPAEQPTRGSAPSSPQQQQAQQMARRAYAEANPPASKTGDRMRGMVTSLGYYSAKPGAAGAKRRQPSRRVRKVWSDMSPAERFRSLGLTSAHLAALTPTQLTRLALALRNKPEEKHLVRRSGGRAMQDVRRFESEFRSHDAMTRIKPLREDRGAPLTPAEEAARQRESGWNSYFTSTRQRSVHATDAAAALTLARDEVQSGRVDSKGKGQSQPPPVSRLTDMMKAALSPELASLTTPEVAKSALLKARLQAELPKFRTKATIEELEREQRALDRRSATRDMERSLGTGMHPFDSHKEVQMGNQGASLIGSRPDAYKGTLLVGGRFDTSFSQNEAMTTAVRSEARRRQKEVFARDRANDSARKQRQGKHAIREKGFEAVVGGQFSSAMLVATHANVKDLQSKMAQVRQAEDIRRRRLQGEFVLPPDPKLQAFRKHTNPYAAASPTSYVRPDPAKLQGIPRTNQELHQANQPPTDASQTNQQAKHKRFVPSRALVDQLSSDPDLNQRFTEDAAMKIDPTTQATALPPKSTPATAPRPPAAQHATPFTAPPAPGYMYDGDQYSLPQRTPPASGVRKGWSPELDQRYYEAAYGHEASGQPGGGSEAGYSWNASSRLDRLTHPY